MTDPRYDCDRFAEWMLETGGPPESPFVPDHLETCSECRDQWHAHRMLAVNFADLRVPELSPTFEATLDRKLASRVEIRPLRGWRKAAMLTYAAAALALVGWALEDVPLPTIDLSTPWVPAALFLAVPLTLMFAIAVSRWLPGSGARGELSVLAV
jgi:predicted anti-sigma-YlaC factor YlaD